MRRADIGGIPLNELNKLEVEFLLTIEFDLGVTTEEYAGRTGKLLRQRTLQMVPCGRLSIVDPHRPQSAASSIGLPWNCKDENDRIKQGRNGAREMLSCSVLDWAEDPEDEEDRRTDSDGAAFAQFWAVQRKIPTGSCVAIGQSQKENCLRCFGKPGRTSWMPFCLQPRLAAEGLLPLGSD